MSKGKIRERALFRITQKVALYDSQEKKFLLAKASDLGGEFVRICGPWDLPGGHIDHGEGDMNDAIDRELQEEIGDVSYETVSELGGVRMDYGDFARVMIGHVAYYKGGDIKLSEEHSEYRWESAEDIAKNKEYKPWLKEFIKKATKRIGQIEAYNMFKQKVS